MKLKDHKKTDLSKSSKFSKKEKAETNQSLDTTKAANSSSTFFQKHKKRIAKFTIALALGYAIYLLGAPFLPHLKLRYQQATDETQGFKYQSNLLKIDGNNKNIDTEALKPIPVQNTLVIPQIGVDGQIFEGQGEDTLLQGVWRRPQTSTPDLGGNTVLTAHRFEYTKGPNTFYHLEKLKVGDKFAVFWNEKEYDYEVFNIEIVTPDRIDIEYDTEEPIITLYTCTPLWTSEKRLVIQAKLIEKVDKV